MEIQGFEDRKREHIQHALNPAHQAATMSGLDLVHLVHEALPDLNFDEIHLDTPCLGRSLSTPFFVSGMTAGHIDAARINCILATACHQRGWAMGVGSQRRDLDDESVDGWKGFRIRFPGLMLFGNIGITQVVRCPISKIRKLIDMIEANALVIHTNPLQEAIQSEGTPHFKDSLRALEVVCQQIQVPVILKETGCGFSLRTMIRLREIGLAAVDVSGLGGTHWGRIEGVRASSDSLRFNAARTFANWGESTVSSVFAARKAGWVKEIWASGGVRSGLDAAKLIALGAHRIGYAQPALNAALVNESELVRWMELQEFELRIALFCTGCRTLDDLRGREELWKANAI